LLARADRLSLYSASEVDAEYSRRTSMRPRQLYIAAVARRQADLMRAFDEFAMRILAAVTFHDALIFRFRLILSSRCHFATPRLMSIESQSMPYAIMH